MRLRQKSQQSEVPRINIYIREGKNHVIRNVTFTSPHLTVSLTFFSYRYRPVTAGIFYIMPAVCRRKEGSFSCRIWTVSLKLIWITTHNYASKMKYHFSSLYIQFELGYILTSDFFIRFHRTVFRYIYQL